MINDTDDGIRDSNVKNELFPINVKLLVIRNGHIIYDTDDGILDSEVKNEAFF